ncbi:MAG TPA: hypothetical protein VFP56_06570 [Candidatus Limnocylindrales bacterium]|nr:hypothetical protein [Candidatus Limnocylindrales bacterium]
MRRKKVFTPKPPPSPASEERAAIAAARTVSINLDAMAGKTDVRQGARVRILSGLYMGELGTVESLVSGVIPAAVVRTDAGRTRRVRAVDLQPAGPETPAAEPA